MSKTFRYTTREGAVWLVRECVPLPHAPGFWLGWKKGRHDREQVVIHEHRCEVVAPVVAPVERRGVES